MPKTISKKYNTLRQAERYQNLLYNKFDNVKLIKSPMFTEYGTYVWAVSGEINPRPKRNPQPKRKNAFSAFKKDYVNFKGSEISDVSFQDIGKSVTIMVTLKDGTKIFSWENADIALRQKNRSTGTGDRVSGDLLVRFLIGNYVK